MFSKIYKHELNVWFKKPAFYIYIVILMAIGLLLSASSAGIFDSFTVTVGGAKIVNSPKAVNALFNTLNVFLMFLLPSIIGATINRDFKSEMHSVLYSYPFTKVDYLLGKFLSAFTIVAIITLCLGVSLAVGFHLPGTNPDIVGAFDISAYLYSYFLFIIPNMLLYGAIVFAVVTFSRNITAGFITIVIMMLLQGLMEHLFGEEETRFLAGLLDPFGGASLHYYTKYWTLDEQNTLALPIKPLIIYNRLIWLGVSSAIVTLIYKKFSFSQNAVKFSLFKKKKSERMVKDNFGGIIRIKLPKAKYNYSFLTNLKTMCKLSNIDFKFVVKDLPFIAITLVGLIITLIALSQSGKIMGTQTLPLTSNVLGTAIGGMFLSICIVTFLYSGLLIHRANRVNASHLVDITPTPNWVFMYSKLIAMVKVQFVLYAMIMLAGLVYQTYKGFYDYDFAYYLFRLFVVEFISIFVWTLLAFLVHTLVKNAYVGFFILLVLFIGLPMLSFVGVEQAIFKYNSGGGVRYSDMNGFGTSLKTYFTYKGYWAMLGMVFLTLAGLFWLRGIPSSFKERLQIFKSRLNVVTKITSKINEHQVKKEKRSV